MVTLLVVVSHYLCNYELLPGYCTVQSCVRTVDNDFDDNNLDGNQRLRSDIFEHLQFEEPYVL